MAGSAADDKYTGICCSSSWKFSSKGTRSVADWAIGGINTSFMVFAANPYEVLRYPMVNNKKKKKYHLRSWALGRKTLVRRKLRMSGVGNYREMGSMWFGVESLLSWKSDEEEHFFWTCYIIVIKSRSFGGCQGRHRNYIGKSNNTVCNKPLLAGTYC